MQRSLIYLALLLFPLLSFAQDLPVITQLSPNSPVNPYVNQTVTLSVVATSAYPLTYQWFKDGVAISGATASSYTTPPVANVTAVRYYVRVANAGRAVNSALISVKGITDVPTISSFTPTGILNPALASSLTMSVVATSAYPLTYQWLRNGLNIAGATSSTYTIPSVASTSVGYYSVRVSNLGNSTVSPSFTLNPGLNPGIASQTTGPIAVSPQAAIGLKISTPTTLYTQYQWYKNGVGISGATLNAYQISSAKATDAGVYSVSIVTPKGSVLSDPISVTVGSGTAVPLSVEQAPPATVTMELGLPNSLAMYVTGDGPVSGQWLFNGSPIVGATSFLYSIPSFAQSMVGAYSLSLTSPINTVTTGTIAVKAVQYPTLTSYPYPFQFVYAGDSVSFSAPVDTGVAGLAPSYQWLRGTGGISGATGPTFSMSAVTSAMQNSYKVRFWPNGYSGFSEMSYPIQLTVVPVGQPKIKSISGKYTYKVGETLSLQANVMGPNLSYQWLRSGVAIPGATSSSYTLADVQTSHQGSYGVRITNANGSDTLSVFIKVIGASDAPLTANQLALLINDNDPFSVAVGAYYQTVRKIPAGNVIHVNIPVTNSMTRTNFATLRSQILASLPSEAQVIAIAWTAPFTVECNSFTSALSRGFDPQPCDNHVGTYPTCSWGTLGRSPYYDSNSHQPRTTAGFLPSMMLAGRTIAQAQAMIDRGVAADGSFPQGSALLMYTPDTVRSVRAQEFVAEQNFAVGHADSDLIDTRVVVGKNIWNESNIMFQFNGLIQIPSQVNTTYLPGAFADNLTSFGGAFAGSGQTSILDLIPRLGLTGSFGTVSEPCAYTEKFTEPRIMIQRYSHGDTLIEAVWKSVWITFQGNFVGEPLSAPYR